MISVILPVFNGSNYLKSSIESVLSQVDCDFELVVLDDCSSDGSADLLHEYMDLPNFRFIQNATNLGLFATLNAGIRQSRGDFIKLWAQDDIMLPGCLAAFQNAFATDRESSFVWCRSATIDRKVQTPHLLPTASDLYQPELIQSWNIELCLRHFWWCGNLHGNISLLGFPRTTFDALGGFNARMSYSGDIDFTARALCLHVPMCIDFIFVAVRNHTGQLSRSVDHICHELLETQAVFEQLRLIQPPCIEGKGMHGFIRRCELDRLLPYRTSNALRLMIRKPKTLFFALRSIHPGLGPTKLLANLVRISLLRKLSPHSPVQLFDPRYPFQHTAGLPPCSGCISRGRNPSMHGI